MKRNILVIDDLRTFSNPRGENVEVIYARTYQEGMEYLLSGMLFAEVWLDHDLGTYENGYHIAQHMEEHAARKSPLIRVDAFILHTSNPVGRDKMRAALDRYYKVYEVNASDFFEV